MAARSHSIAPDGTRVAGVGYAAQVYVPSVVSPEPSASQKPRKSIASISPVIRSTSDMSDINIQEKKPEKRNSIVPDNAKRQSIVPERKQSVFQPLSNKAPPKGPSKISQCCKKVCTAPLKLPKWCLKKDYCGIINMFWFSIGLSVLISVNAIFGLVIGKIVLQQKANMNTRVVSNGLAVGQPCNTSRDCTTDAMCQSNICQCPVVMYYDEDYGQCLVLKTYGQSCAESRECNTFVGLICSDNFCTCTIQQIWGSFYGYQACSRAREVGETCTATSECTGNAYCGLVNGVNRCTCLSTQFISGLTGQCEYVRKINERCYNWYQECPPYTTCRPNNNNDGTYFCQCNQGTYYDATTQQCLTHQTINGYCVANTNQNNDENTWVPMCNYFQGLYCNNGICTCPSTQFWNGTYCTYYSSYGRSCSAIQLCSIGDPNLVCGIPPGGSQQTMCYCNTNYYFDTYLQQCVQQKSEGMTCFSSGECVDNATCTSNVCTCYPGYWSNTATGQCTEMLIYGATCSSATGSIPCNNLIYGLNCFSNLCGCDPTYEYWDGSYCNPRLHYGETCSATNLCAAYRGLTCSVGLTCVCNSGLTYSGTYNWCI